MTNIEKRALNYAGRYIFWAVIALAVFISALVRGNLLPVASSDMNQFLLPWYHEIRENGGLWGIPNHSANYSDAYLYLLYFATRLPLQPITAIKLFSLIADYLLALGAAAITWQLQGQNPKRLQWAAVTLAVVALLPTVVLNSAYWGQCDSIYAAFGVWALVCVLRQRWVGTFVLFGLALCFKLQAIFLLPFFLILYVARRKFSIVLFLLPPGVFLLSNAWSAIYTRNLLAGLLPYVDQVEQGQAAIYVNYHNLSSFVWGREYDYFGKALVLLTFLACFALFAWVLATRPRLAGDSLLLLAGWSVMTCVVLLPGMHERYAYLGELLLILWALQKPRLHRVLPACLFWLVGYAACSNFLFGVFPHHSVLLALLNIANYAVVTLLLVRTLQGAPRAVPRFGRHWRAVGTAAAPVPGGAQATATKHALAPAPPVGDGTANNTDAALPANTAPEDDSALPINVENGEPI